MAGIADPREALIQRSIQLQRVSNSIAADRSGVLRKLFDDIASEVAKIDPTGPAAMRYRRDRVAKLLERVRELTGASYLDWYKGVRSDLAKTGRAHADHTAADLVATLGPVAAKVRTAAVSQNMLKAILDRNPFQGETLKGWAKDLEAQTLRRIRQQVQIGMVEEEDIASIVRRIRGTRNGPPGVWQASQRDATAVVRTAVTTVAAEARAATLKANAEVLKAVQYVASLDDRTCPICGSLDGKTWPVGDPHIIKPALHFNCRCTLVPVVDWSGLGIAPPDEGLRLARDPKTGKWIQVPTSETYDQWLRSAPAAKQDQILGPTRAKLFRSGKVRLDELVGRDRRLLTLDELSAA